MKSKSVIAAVLLIGMSFTQVFAQKSWNSHMENKTPEEASKMMTEKLTKKLALTEGQVKSVQYVLLESFTQRQEIHQKYPQLKQARSEMNTVRKSYSEKKKSILTENQLEQLRASKKQTGQQPGNKSQSRDGERKSPEQRLAMMKSKIELTATQEKELLQIFAEMDGDLKELKAKYPELEKAKSEMKRLHQETNTQMEKVLTPEQFEKYKQHKPKGKKGNQGKQGNKKGHKGAR